MTIEISPAVLNQNFEGWTAAQVRALGVPLPEAIKDTDVMRNGAFDRAIPPHLEPVEPAPEA